jgi:GNAT superfamily N-acetyltransferase
MTPDDHKRVSEIVCRCYHWVAERDGFTPDQVQRLIAARGTVATLRDEAQRQAYFVASNGRTVVGIAALHHNEITRLFVDPARHGQGVGRLLYEMAEHTIREAGYPELILGAFQAAVPFYEAMGMSVEARRIAIAGPLAGHTVTVMRKRL